MHPCFVHFITTHRGFKIECTAIESDLKIITFSSLGYSGSTALIISHHYITRYFRIKKRTVWVPCPEIKKKLVQYKMIGQGKGTRPVQYCKYFFFRADSLNKKMREREGHIEHKFLHKIHLPLPSFQWNCIDFCPFPVEESELCVIFIIAAAV